MFKHTNNTGGNSLLTLQSGGSGGGDAQGPGPACGPGHNALGHGQACTRCASRRKLGREGRHCGWRLRTAAEGDKVHREHGRERA